MNISFLGGASEVGASSILVNINEKNILMDCGIRQGANKDPLPDFRTIQEKGGIDAIIVSHAHMDHIGALPIIAKEYPLAKVYTNSMTKDLMRVLLYDSIKIMNSRESEIPMYREEDVLDLLDRTITHGYEKQFEILEGISITFYMAGHIPGASIVYVTTEDRGSLFYSGDFSLFPQIAVEGAKFPKLTPDVVIVESTYGDKLHSNRKIEEDRLITILKDVINRGGKALVPAFALGRSQEVILIIKKAMANGTLPKCKVYVDGMVRDINVVFKNNPIYLRSSLCKKIMRGFEPFYDENIIPVAKGMNRDDIIKENEPQIFVTSSGMISGGPSQYYAEKLLGDENSTIIISGYQDEESPGRKVLNLFDAPEEERRFELNGRIYNVKCSVEKVSLSAHGDKSEIRAVNERLSPKELFLVHGDKEIIKSLGGEVSCNTSQRVYIPSIGETYDILIDEPRKQYKKIFKFRVGMKSELKPKDLKFFREFILEKYGRKAFTLEDLAYIWGYGDINEELLERYRAMLTREAYFVNDEKRLFMFSPATEEQISKALNDSDFNQIQVIEFLNDRFSKYGVRKVGVNFQERKASLIFDFPQALPKGIHRDIRMVSEKIRWDIEIKDNTNLSALDTYIRELIGYDNVKKISHNLPLGEVTITLNNKMVIGTKRKDFLTKTGFMLLVKGEGTSSAGYEVAADGEPIEQNKFLELIDNAYMDEKFKPYRKSVLSKGVMRLSFITPKAGEKTQDIIEWLKKESGWSIEIQNSYNQDRLLFLVEREVGKLGLTLKKRPAFLGDKGLIKLVFNGDVSEEVFKILVERINEEAQIGCIR